MLQKKQTMIVRIEGKSGGAVREIRRTIAMFFHEQGIEPSIVQTPSHLFLKVDTDVLFPGDRLSELRRLK